MGVCSVKVRVLGGFRALTNRLSCLVLGMTVTLDIVICLEFVTRLA